MARTWLQTRVAVKPELADVVGQALIDGGSPGLITEEREGVVELVAYFEREEDMRRTCEGVQHLGVARIDVARIDEEDWAENWKQHFQPIAVGERLYVCPPWHDGVPAGREAIVIDPGMAFGTGNHATTRSCLELLDRHLPRDADVLDVGTGSGVLAIAALRLGARRAVGVDVDPVALEAMRENARRNGVADRCAQAGSLDRVEGLFDLALANLQLSTLVDLEEPIARRVKPAGLLIASGLLREELGAWKAHYASHWEAGESRGDEQWLAIAARRRA